MLDTFAADGMDDLPELFDPLTQPGELALINHIMFRVAGLYIRLLQFLEHRALLAIAARPYIVQPPIELLGLLPQEAQIVIVRGVEGHC